MLRAMSTRTAAAIAITTTWVVACGGGAVAPPAPSNGVAPREAADAGAAGSAIVAAAPAPSAHPPAELPAPPPPTEARFGVAATGDAPPSGAFALVHVDDATEVQPLSASARACVRAKGTIQVKLAVGARGGSGDVRVAPTTEGADAAAPCLLEHVRREIGRRLPAGARIDVVVVAR